MASTKTSIGMRHPRRFERVSVFVALIALGSFAVPAKPAIAQFFGTRQTPAPRAPTIVGRMGTEMSESDARHSIAFRPFAPFGRVVTVALLPPFRGDDIRRNRGIGYEFIGSMARHYALAEWPANGGTIERFPALVDAQPACASARMFLRGTKPNGIVWSTPHGLVMTLQADGANDARTLRIQWKQLIRRGVCR